MLTPGVFRVKPSTINVDKPITITGIVKEVQFVNPNVRITVEVSAPDGTTRSYSVKATNPRALVSRGLTLDTLKNAGIVTIEGFSAADGSLTIGGAAIVFPDGRKVSLGL